VQCQKIYTPTPRRVLGSSRGEGVSKAQSFEITITIGTAILIKNNKKLCSYIRAIFFIIVIIISTRVVFLRV